MNALVRRALSAGLFAVSTAATLVGAITPAQAATGLTAFQNTTIRQTTATATSTTSTPVTTTRLTTRLGGTLARQPFGNLISQLTASDCRLAGGTVVVPGDDRCGSLGAAYCRYPDTLAACITER